jgi:hypothetical protein
MSNDVMLHISCFNPCDADKLSQITHPEPGTDLLIGLRGRQLVPFIRLITDFCC